MCLSTTLESERLKPLSLELLNSTLLFCTILSASERPKQRWMDNVREDMREKHLSEDDVHDRAVWRRSVRNIDPT